MAREKIVFTNGCFDIITVGHVRYLEQAKWMGDTLIVGLNSDLSFKKIRGRKSFYPQDDRCEILEAMWFVDEVILFDEETPLDLIKEIRPDILVKGSDHDPETVVGREYAGEVRCIDVGADWHTTDYVLQMVAELTKLLNKSAGSAVEIDNKVKVTKVI